MLPGHDYFGGIEFAIGFGLATLGWGKREARRHRCSVGQRNAGGRTIAFYLRLRVFNFAIVESNFLTETIQIRIRPLYGGTEVLTIPLLSRFANYFNLAVFSYVQSLLFSDLSGSGAGLPWFWRLHGLGLQGARAEGRAAPC